MQNFVQGIQCKEIDFCLQEKKICLPLASLMHDGVILLNLKTNSENKVTMVKKELDIESIIKNEVVLEDNNSKSSAIPLLTVVDEMKNANILQSEDLAEKILSQFRFRNLEEQAKNSKNPLKERDICQETAANTNTCMVSENKQSFSASKMLSLKEKYRKFNKNHNMKALKRWTQLGTNSLTKSRNQHNYKLNLSKESNSLQPNEVTLNTSSADCLVSCRFCKRSFKVLEDCQNHNCDNSKYVCNQMMHKCELCSAVFKYKNYLDRHMKGHNRNNCKFCSAQFTKRKALCKHLKTVHNISEAEKLYNCSFCGKAFTKRLSLNVHLKSHAHGKLLCMKCGFMFVSEQEYIEHGKEHIKDTKFECVLCGKKFVRRQQHDQHMMGHTRHSCPMCDVTFSTKKMLLKHQQTIHGVTVMKKHQCSTCHKSFVRPIHLQIHERMHTGEKPVKCSQCEKSFATERSLSKHMKTARHLQVVNDGKKVELEKPFLCSICGATFFQQQSLFRHIEILHTPGEAIKCSLCDYSTKCKANLKRHAEGHSNIKRYVCEICGASFRALATLKEHHLFVHSESRSFVCDVCNKSFKNKSSLQRHLRIHSEVRPYKCHCNRDYKRLSHLKRHMASAHCMTIKKSSDAKSLEICKIDTNKKNGSKSKAISKKVKDVKENTASEDNISSLSLPNQNFLSEDLFDSALNKTAAPDPLSIENATSDSNNEYSCVPCQNIENFIDKNELNNKPYIDTKSPLISVVPSDSQDSVSLDEPDLNLSPNYFTFSFSASPLGTLAMESMTPNLQLQNQHDTPSTLSTQDSANRPKSLPNLGSQTSNIDSFFPFSLRSSELPSSFLLGSDLPPSLEHNSSSKQLFGDSGDILSLPNFTSNSESSITECPTENFFSMSRNLDIWDVPRDNRIASLTDDEITSDRCSKVPSPISNFSSDSSSLLACNLVFSNDSLLDCPIDANSFNTEDFVMT